MVKFTTDELTFLLATDSSKAWVLTGRTINTAQSVLPECEKDDLLIFRGTISPQDTLKMQFETGPIQCPGQADSIIYQGYWMALDSTSGHFLHWVIKGDTSIRVVNFITSELLNISYSEGNDQITEDFTTILE
jgi:hypothetical protein